MKRIFGNLRLAAKLAVGFGICLLLTVAVVATSISSLGSVRTQIHRFSDDSVPGLLALQQFSYDSAQLRSGAYRVAGFTGADADSAAKRCDEYIASAEKALDEYDKSIHDPQDRKNFDKMADAWKAYKQAWITVEPKLKSEDGKVAFMDLESATTTIYRDTLKPAVAEMFSWNDKYAKTISTESDQTVAASSRLIVGMGAFALVLGTLFGVIISRSISRPLSRVATQLASLRDESVTDLKGALNAMGHGDLTVEPIFRSEPVKIESRDEVGQMAATFNEMLAMLEESFESYSTARRSVSSMVREIADSSKSVSETSQMLASASEQSSSAAQEIATGSEKLAISATEAAEVMTRLTDQVNGVGVSSQKQGNNVDEAARALSQAEQGITGVASAAQQMAAAAYEGNSAVSATVEAMNRVQQQVTYSASKVQELDEKGKEIGRIVLSIQSISEQTNLLALNAAIEAARAGEHGRGFAVVADEVRKLAEQAGNATKEISSLIGSVTATVQETVVAINATREQVSEGASRSEAAGRALGQILEASEEVAARSQEVAAVTQSATQVMGTVAMSANENLSSTQEMSSGADRVFGSITHVAAISEESAAGAEELTAAIAEVGQAATRLSGMSSDLRDLVSKFKVDEEGKTTKLKLVA